MRWRVVAMHGRATSGRARPPRVELIGTDGDRCEGYLKSPLFHERKPAFCLEREWVATRLAKEMNLPCANIVPVEVTPELVQIATSIGIDHIADGPELLLASVSLGPGWSEWSSAVNVTKNQLEQASEIYFFDTMVQNWDRVMPNPNLLVNGSAYGMIDHEESFISAAGSEIERGGAIRPWEDGGVSNDVGEYLEHPLWRGIKKHTNANFVKAVECWKSLPVGTLRGYALDDVFDDWSRDVANDIIDYLMEAIEHVDAVHMQIEANKCH